MAWVASGIAVAGGIMKIVQGAKQKKEAKKLKQSPVSGKTVEAETRARQAANQATDTIAEDQRAQLDQAAANSAASVKETGGSSVDQLQSIQATERQRQTGEQDIGISLAQRRRQDETKLGSALAGTAAEENANRANYENQKAALLNAGDQNIYGGVTSALAGGATAGIAAGKAFGGGGGAAVAMTGDNNAQPTIGTPNAGGVYQPTTFKKKKNKFVPGNRGN